MTEFYFVRHGQTEINRDKAFNGGLSDSPLTTSGVQDAQAMGTMLAAVHFSQVLTSSMPRAMATTRYIMAQNPWPTPVVPVAGLREMRLGVWDGQPIAPLLKTPAVQTYLNDPKTFDEEIAATVQAETYQSVLTRSAGVIESTVMAQPAGTVLVVGHGLVFLVLLNHLLGGDLQTLRQRPVMRNAAVSHLTTKDGTHYEVVAWDRRADDAV